jgi:hypothetical protein
MMTPNAGPIEIGIGGDLAGLRGRERGGLSPNPRQQYRGWEGDFHEQFTHLVELMADYDPEAAIQFIETMPPADRAEEFGEVAADCGIPVRQFTALYVVGGDATTPDALHTLRANLDLARRVPTIERLNMQVLGTNSYPTVEALVDFYIAAEDLAQNAGIELYTESHVDRFTYDPRRLIAVHEALLDRTSGRLGLRVAADFSHYVHQLGNPHFSNWEAISSGVLNIDPRDPDNYVSRAIIAAGLIGYGHLRMAVPNDLPRGQGSIQYPVVDPLTDPETADLPNGGLKEPWAGERCTPWLTWYREIFTYQLRHPERPTARFSTEFIGDMAPGEYRVDSYRNLFQNIAMVSTAQRMIREIAGSVSPAAHRVD